MDIVEDWLEIKSLFKQAFRSSLHFSIASIDEKGMPHISPIGSVILGDPGKAIYFEEFTMNLPKHIKINQKICIMAVNSGKWFWYIPVTPQNACFRVSETVQFEVSRVLILVTRQV